MKYILGKKEQWEQRVNWIVQQKVRKKVHWRERESVSVDCETGQLVAWNKIGLVFLNFMKYVVGEKLKWVRRVNCIVQQKFCVKVHWLERGLKQIRDDFFPNFMKYKVGQELQWVQRVNSIVGKIIRAKVHRRECLWTAGGPTGCVKTCGDSVFNLTVRKLTDGSKGCLKRQQLIQED